jgi:aspartate racemase
MHIGLIGGIGPAATVYYYRELVRLFAEANTKLDLTIVNADSREMVGNLVGQDTRAQAEIFRACTTRLKAGGCDFVAVTSMGGHFCIADFEAISPLPVLNAIPVMDEEFARLDLKRVGILGTSAVMNSGLYGVSSTKVIAPALAERQRVHDTYVAMAEAGAATDAQRAYMEDVAFRLMRDDSVEAIVLGGTDLFVAFDKPEHPYKIFDCALVHARAIAHRAMNS